MSESFSKKEEALLSEAFSILDKNGDGEISCQELQQIMATVGKSRTKQEVEQIMKRVDKDGNGTVTLSLVL